MFDFIVFRRTGRQKILDPGLLAETLLFYQKVHIVFDAGSLREFIKTIGLDLLTELLGRKGVTASFQRDITGVITNSPGGIALHNCAIFRVSGDQENKRFSDIGYVSSVVKRELGNAASTKRRIRKFTEKISFSPLPENGQGVDDILGESANDLREESFVRSCVENIVSNSAPGLELPPGWIFRVHFVGTVYGNQPQFAIETNLNFDKLNTYYHQYVPPSHSSLTPAHLVAYIVGAREAEYISSKHLSELIIDPVTSSVMRLKYLQLLKKRERQCLEIDLFQNMIFSDGRAIREAINSGEKSFREFLDILDKSLKFKAFLASQNPELGLFQSYYAELKKENWVDKLPSKATRIVLANGLGAAAEGLFPTGGVSLLLGLGYSAFDSFLLDKLLKGWRPNQFIDVELVPFVSGKR